MQSVPLDERDGKSNCDICARNFENEDCYACQYCEPREDHKHQKRNIFCIECVLDYKKLNDEFGKTFVAAESEAKEGESVEKRLARLSEENLKSEAPEGAGNFQAQMYNKCRNSLFHLLVDNYNQIEKQANLFTDQAEFGSWTEGQKYSGMRMKGTANIEHGIIRVVLPDGNIQVMS